MRPRARAPRPVERAPSRPLPPGACDTHVHLFAAPGEHPLDPARTEDPAPGTMAEWIGRLRDRMTRLGLERAVVVQSVLYREDAAMTAAALAVLGPAFRGIALVRPDVADRELDALHAAGFHGVRLDLVHPGALTAADAIRLAPRLAERGWHLQLFGRLTTHAEPIEALAREIACEIALDHHGYPELTGGIEAPSALALLRLLDGGRVWLKLSSTYRLAPAPHDALDPLVRALIEARPDRLVWGSNWPHVRWEGPIPDETVLLDTLARQSPDPATYEAILARNPERLYGFPPAGRDCADAARDCKEHSS